MSTTTNSVSANQGMQAYDRLASDGNISDADFGRLIGMAEHMAPREREAFKIRLEARAAAGDKSAGDAAKLLAYDKAMKDYIKAHPEMVVR